MLLLVEVGYKMRFFGDDALVASQVSQPGVWGAGWAGGLGRRGGGTRGGVGWGGARGRGGGGEQGVGEE